jgi:predicted aconitase
VGVSLAAGAEGTGGHVGLAYKQEQYFIIPKTKTAVGGQEKIDAVSVIGCSYVVTEGVAGVEFEERLATGDAAIAAAANIDPNSYICTPTQFPVTQQTGQSGGGTSGGQQ